MVEVPTPVATDPRTRRVGFESAYKPLGITQTGPRTWDTLYRMLYWDGEQEWEVPEGSGTDLGSVPWIVMWLVSPVTGAPATVLHDRLCRVEVPAGRCTHRRADAIFRQALGTLVDPETGKPEVSTPRRWLMWAAVRWHSLFEPVGWRGWSRDAPAVLGITVLALPALVCGVILLPPWLLLTAVERVTERFERRMEHRDDVA